MNPLLLVILFLTLLGSISITQVKRFTLSSHAHAHYLRMEQRKENIEKWREKARQEQVKLYLPQDQLDEFSVDQPAKPSPHTPSHEKRSYSFQIDLDRPPNNSRLNLYLFLHDETASKNQAFLSQWEIAASLLRNLYGSQPFFQEIPHCEYALLQALYQQREKTEDFLSPDAFAGLDLHNKELQQVFYKMLKGAYGLNGEGYPSLLHFISFDSHLTNSTRKLNLMFASKNVLDAVFRNETVVSRLLEGRGYLLEQILHQEQQKVLSNDKPLTRRLVKEELKNLFTAVLAQEGLHLEQYEPLFDFSLGKIGTVYLLTDTKNGLNCREVIVSSNS